jgi:hypothetical protein
MSEYQYIYIGMRCTESLLPSFLLATAGVVTALIIKRLADEGVCSKRAIPDGEGESVSAGSGLVASILIPTMADTAVAAVVASNLVKSNQICWQRPTDLSLVVASCAAQQSTAFSGANVVDAKPPFASTLLHCSTVIPVGLCQQTELAETHMPSEMWGIAAYMFTSLFSSTSFPFMFSLSTTSCICAELLAAAVATTSASSLLASAKFFMA